MKHVPPIEKYGSLFAWPIVALLSGYWNLENIWLMAPVHFTLMYWWLMYLGKGHYRSEIVRRLNDVEFRKKYGR